MAGVTGSHDQEAGSGECGAGEPGDTQVLSAHTGPASDKGADTGGHISCVDTSDTENSEDITNKDKSEKEDKETE